MLEIFPSLFLIKWQSNFPYGQILVGGCVAVLPFESFYAPYYRTWVRVWHPYHHQSPTTPTPFPHPSFDSRLMGDTLIILPLLSLPHPLKLSVYGFSPFCINLLPPLWSDTCHFKLVLSFYYYRTPFCIGCPPWLNSLWVWYPHHHYLWTIKWSWTSSMTPSPKWTPFSHSNFPLSNLHRNVRIHGSLLYKMYTVHFTLWSL